MQLVILAAGFGRRFGGLKQLAPIGPNGEAIMDYTASAAYDCGYRGVVLVIREEIRAEMLAHVARRWPRGLGVEVVEQIPRAGTVYASLSAKPVIDGPFAIANADDLYGTSALALIEQHYRPAAPRKAEHLLIGYHLVRTVLTDAPVKRGLCDIGSDGLLRGVVEHAVELRADGSFDARALGEPDSSRTVLAGSELVSMNLWGFSPSMFDYLEEAGERAGHSDRSELILPTVVNEVVSSGRDRVEVLETVERCIGVTHQEDIAIVREELALETQPANLLKTSRSS